MKKQQPKRETTNRIQEKDLPWVKGSSGYNVVAGKDGSGGTQDGEPGGGTQGGDPGGG